MFPPTKKDRKSSKWQFRCFLGSKDWWREAPQAHTATSKLSAARWNTNSRMLSSISFLVSQCWDCTCRVSFPPSRPHDSKVLEEVTYYAVLDHQLQSSSCPSEVSILASSESLPLDTEHLPLLPLLQTSKPLLATPRDSGANWSAFMSEGPSRVGWDLWSKQRPKTKSQRKENRDPNSQGTTPLFLLTTFYYKDIIILFVFFLHKKNHL